MASKLEECCKPGITWTGTPSGRETKMADTDVYLTQNFDKTDGPILLLMIDVYGYHLPNIRLVADRYAELGYRAIIPDPFNGKPHVAGKDVMEFIKANPIPEKMQMYDSILQTLKAKYKGPVGVQGFCWGAKPAILLAGQKKVAAVVVNHASLLDKEDVEGIDVPTWFNFAGPNDPMINPEQREKYEKILDSKKACGYKYYPDQNHGWTLKGDDKDPKVQAAAEDAFNLAVSFFKKHVA